MNLNIKLLLFIFILILLVYLLITLLSYEKARNKIYYIKGGCNYHKWGCCPDNITSKLDFLGTNCFDDRNKNKKDFENEELKEDELKEDELKEDELKDHGDIINKIKDEVDNKCLEKEEQFIKKRNKMWV